MYRVYGTYKGYYGAAGDSPEIFDLKTKWCEKNCPENEWYSTTAYFNLPTEELANAFREEFGEYDFSSMNNCYTTFIPGRVDVGAKLPKAKKKTK